MAPSCYGPVTKPSFFFSFFSQVLKLLPSVIYQKNSMCLLQAVLTSFLYCTASLRTPMQYIIVSKYMSEKVQYIIVPNLCRKRCNTLLYLNKCQRKCNTLLYLNICQRRYNTLLYLNICRKRYNTNKALQKIVH